MMQIYRAHVLVCCGTGCVASGSKETLEEFKKQLQKHNLTDEVQVVQAGCFGICEEGPNVIVYPEGSLYTMVSPADVAEIVEEHLIKGRIVKGCSPAESRAKGKIIPLTA